MIRLAIPVSVLLHGALLAALVAGPLRAPPPEPGEPPAVEVLLGATVGPSGVEGSAEQGTPAQPEAIAEAEPPIPEPPMREPPMPEPPMAEPRVAEPRVAEPVPPSPVLVPLAALPEPPPPPPPPPQAAPSPRPPPRPAPARPAEAPQTRPLLGDQLAALGAGMPGAASLGEQVAARLDPAARNPPPAYPATARERGQQGAVGVRLRIDTDGRVLRVDVVESSGYALLDQAVVQALARWRLLPATRGGQPVVADFYHRTIFRLD